MEGKKEIYADGIGQIHFAGGMVRFDFVTLQPEGDDAGQGADHHAAAGVPRCVQLDAAADRQVAGGGGSAEERSRQVSDFGSSGRIILPEFRNIQNRAGIWPGLF